MSADRPGAGGEPEPAGDPPVDESTDFPGGDPDHGHSRISVFSGTLGATLEWYDFTLYVYLAPVIATLFFPSSSTVDSLLATFGVFAAGYLMRPLGAALIGNYGDSHGRKSALVLSISVMGAGMLIISALPTEASIGVLAPILLVVVRLAQGFSLGGEFGGAITLLAESVPARQRGWFVNYAQVAAGVGTLLSSGIVFILNIVFTNSQVNDYAWRFPFIFGAILGVVAVVALLRTPESEAFDEQAGKDEEEIPVKGLFRTERKPLLLGSLLNGYQSLSYYVVVTFVPTYLVSFQGARPEEGILAGMIAAFIFTIGSPMAGGLSDRLGRRTVMFGGAVLMAVFAVPLFLVLSEAVTVTVVPAQAILMGLVTLFSGATLVTTTELFSTRTRYTGVSVSFNIGATVFGGTAPLIATGLISLLDTDLAPAYMLVGAALLTLPLLLNTPETAPVRTGETELG
ncbi:MAG TPA: MFS transporter [Solirubrobacterales bacterium]|nr:MFS transporter [Solirubrobacterales bacterium]